MDIDNDPLNDPLKIDIDRLRARHRAEEDEIWHQYEEAKRLHKMAEENAQALLEAKLQKDAEQRQAQEERLAQRQAEKAEKDKAAALGALRRTSY